MEILNKYSTPNDFEYLFFNISHTHNISFAFKARKRSNKDENKKKNGAHKNEIFDYNNGLPENPLYTTSQPSEEMGNTSREKHELGLPNNRPIEPLSVYAVPNKNRSRHQMTNSRDVYAEGYK